MTSTETVTDLHSRRFFISYSRRAKDDSDLAAYLHQGLEDNQQDVFIDTGMPVGTDWVDEIEKRIAWCEFLVVLLSKHSVHSEMVLGEVRRAHRRRRRDGHPRILPIRVNYDGTLDYELDSYLARIQFLNWGTPADSSKILQKVLVVATSSFTEATEEAPPAAILSPGEFSTGRPQAAEDIRTLFPAPGGTIKLDDEFYIRRPGDVVVEELARKSGETLTIKAPWQVGKSSMLVRYLAQCVSADKHFAFIDFQMLTDAELAELETLLGRLVHLLLRGLRLHLPEIPQIHTPSDFTDFIEDEIIAKIDKPLVLAFDEVDCLLGRPYQGDFFSMLRLWHNRRGEPFSRWLNVDLAMAISTEPYLLIAGTDRSPFNVGTVVEPRPFPRNALDGLDERYGSQLTDGELDDLYELVSGHPFLTRLAFYRLASGHCSSFGDLESRAGEPDGPFGDHLRALLVRLRQTGDLLPAMGQAVTLQSVPEDDVYYRLHGAGLVDRRNKRVVPANLVYARFFRSLT